MQDKTHSRIFVTIAKIFGILFLEYPDYFGKLNQLAKSMYGTTLSDMYWYLELQDYLLEIGFKVSKNMQCLFMHENDDGSKIYLLKYIEDMLYGASNPEVKKIEELLQKRFNLALMGQAHWYLATQINQLKNFGI